MPLLKPSSHHRRIPRCVRILLYAAGWFVTGAGITTAATAQELWLIGGSVTPCPEMWDGQCRHPSDHDNRQITLTEEAIDAVVVPELWPESRQNIRVLTRIILRRVAQRVGQNRMPLAQLWHHLATTYISRSGEDLSNAVARNGLERYTDLAGPDPIVLRGDEFVSSLNTMERNLLSDRLTHSRQQQSSVEPALLQAFARNLIQSHGKQARVLVISAARDNPFTPVTALRHVLNDNGLTMDWLPLDSALAMAITEDRCAALTQLRAQYINRYGLHNSHRSLAAQQEQSCNAPDSLNDAVTAAAGLILLDGSVALLHSSFFSTTGDAFSWTRQLARRFHRGELTVAAIGAAAQLAVGRKHDRTLPVMRSERDNTGITLLRDWCQRYRCDGDYHRLQGLGLFDLGAVDTYVAEQGREYRLLRTTADSGAGLGFGIDDGTALIIRRTNNGRLTLTVNGEGSVLVVDTRRAQYDTEGDTWSLRQARMSRLVPGISLQMDAEGDYQVSLPDAHATQPRELIPPSRLVDPYFFRSWTQWFVANDLPYAEAEYHVQPFQALLRLQRPKNDFAFFVASNGLVGFNNLMIDTSFSRSRL